MPKLINIRLTKDSSEVSAMDAQAKALGMPRNVRVVSTAPRFKDLSFVY